MNPSSEDTRFMTAALAFGRRGLGRTAPNPSVGALVVKDGLVVGRGVTADGGRPHAETIALAEAGEAARGATLYVTLEPCSHHGRTGPCCEAIVAAGIGRVVYAIDDPHALVAGKGAAYCREHGVAVTGGICAEAARRDHLGHIRLRTAGRPMVSLKLARTSDGFVAGGPHDPRLAITGVAANGMVHVMRAMHDAIMVGIATVLADDPLMTVRLPGVSAAPLRIVLDAVAQTPPTARLLQPGREGRVDPPVLIVVGDAALAERVDALRALAGVDILVAPAPDGRLDLAAVLAELGTRGLTRVFSEGGPRIAGALLAADLVDEALLFTAPRPLAREGVAALDAEAQRTLADPGRFHLAASAEIGVDRLQRYVRMV